jgi:hypothetical protein
MQESRIKTLATLSGVTLALGLLLPDASRSQESRDRAASPHGGAVELTRHHRFEVVFARTGLKVYGSSLDGKPLDASRLSGKATFYHPSTPTPWFDRTLAQAASPGQAAAVLERTIDLSKVPAQGVKVAFEITGLPDPDEPAASFTVPFVPALAAPVDAATRVTGAAPATITFARATQADQAAINAQRVCKVSGGSLGSMGVPIKVTRGKTSVFLCCQGCVKSVRANPDRYFGTAG